MAVTTARSNSLFRPCLAPAPAPEKYVAEDDLVEVIGRDKTVTASQQKKGGVQALFSLLEENKDAMGLKFYSVGATTLDQVFLTVITDDNVVEEGYGVTDGKKVQRWLCS